MHDTYPPKTEDFSFVQKVIHQEKKINTRTQTRRF